VLWGAWGREWASGATSQSVLQTLLRGLDGGVTVLLHDSGCMSPPGAWKAGLGAVPLLLDECALRGLTVGPVGEHRIRGKPPLAAQPRSLRRGRTTDPTVPVTP
jgi:peptidoglycan-N-acetylglucosamine deacetylase